MKKSNFLFISLIVFIILITYFNSIRNEFVYDDWDLVVREKYEKGKPLLYPFVNALRGGAYRPLRDISHAIDRLIWGEDPMGHHITNILIHTGNSIIVFYIALSIFLKSGTISNFSRAVLPAFLTSVFFGIHPIQTECVTWISGRRDILCGFFFFLGLLMFIKLRSRRKKYYIPGIILCYLLSLSSKEMGVTLPLVLMLYDYLYFRGSRFEINSCRQNTENRMQDTRGSRQYRLNTKYLYISLLILAIAFSILTLDVGTGQQRATFHGESRYLTTLAMAKVAAEYIKLLFFPVNLCVEHIVSVPETVKDPVVLISLFIVAAILVTGIVTLKKNKLISFGIFWFFITLLPVSNILVPVRNMMAERYLYIPSVGFFILAGGLISGFAYRVSAFRLPHFIQNR